MFVMPAAVATMRVRLFLAALSAGVTVVFAAVGEDGWLPLLCWLVSMGLVVQATPPRPLGDTRGAPSSHWTRATDWGLLALLIALATFFRLHRLAEQPNGLWIDELATVRNALTLVATGSFEPLGSTALLQEGWVRTSNTYLYLCWLVLWLGGVTFTAVKMISVLPGILAVPSLYWLARRFLSQPAALAAAGLLAVSLWHVTLSRWGWDEVLLTTLAIWVWVHLHDASEHGSARSYLLAGLLVGLGLHLYLASRLLALAAFAFVALRVVTERGDRGRPLRGLVWLALGTGLAASPVLVGWLRDPAQFFVRIDEVSILSRVLDGNLGLLFQNVKAHLLMFHWAGDRNPRHNLPGLPMLDSIAGVLFAIGLAVALRRWRTPAGSLSILWLGVGLLGGMLSNGAPHAYRTGLVAPACFLLAGWGLAALMTWARSRLPVSSRLELAGVVLLLAVSGATTYVRYFDGRARCEPCWRSTGFGGEIAAFVRPRVDVVLDAGGTLWLDESLASVALGFEVDVLLKHRLPDAPVRSARVAELRAEDLVAGVALFTPEVSHTLPPELAAIEQKTLRDPFGRGIVVAMSRDPALLEPLASDPNVGAP